jgi:hypothetical protein
MIPNSRDPCGRRRRRPPPLSAVARAGATALASPKLLLSVIAAAEAGSQIRIALTGSGDCAMRVRGSVVACGWGLAAADGGDRHGWSERCW